MPTHPGHPAIASTTLVSASRSLLNDAFDSVSLQTVTATAALNPDDGRYVLVAPASHATITLPDPSSDERYQNVRLVLKRTTAGVYTATVVVAGGGLIDGSSSTTLNAQYDCEVLFSDGTAWHRLRDQTNLLAPDYLDFGDWIVGTDDSNPAPVATSDAYTAPDGTTTADELEWDNTTELADESWAEPGASVLEAGDGAEYSFYIDSEVGDGIKTVLEVEDTSVPGLLEQTTVAFSNVFAEEHVVQSQKYAGATPTGAPGDYASFGLWSDGGGSLSQSAIQDPDGGYQAWTYTATSSPREVGENFSDTALASTFSLIALPDWDTGQSWTLSWYVHADSMVSSDYYRWRVQLWQSYSSQKEGIYLSYYPSFPENPLNFTSSTSGGPGYTLAENVRLEDAGNSWRKISVHIRDYSGLANRISWSPIVSSGVGSYTIYKPEIRKGDHVSSQQLLTVEDGVENLLTTDAGASADYTDFNNWGTTGTLTIDSVATSSIAAPDGTLTAQEVTIGATGSGQIYVYVPHIQSDLPNNTVTWSYYIYEPTSTRVVPMRLYSVGTGGEVVFAQFNASGVISFGSTTNGAESYTAEKNIAFEPVGDNGWIKISVTRTQYIANAGQYMRLDPIAGDTLVFWSPELRYGDWVARGKNYCDSDIVASSNWSIGYASKAYSSTAAPDGTLSACAITSFGSPGSPAGNTDYSQAITTGAAGWADGSRATWEFYLKHPLPFTVSMRPLLFYGATYEAFWPKIAEAGGFSGVIDRNQSAGPGYSIADDTSAVQVTSDGWWRYRISLTHFDTSSSITQLSWYFWTTGTEGQTFDVWNPRLTVGNPADARGYFVSGPQNLLGDGSDYSHWLTGTSPRDVPITANTAVAPNGRLEADTLTHTTGVASWDYRAKVKPVSAGITTTYSYYFKIDASLPTSASEQVWVRYTDSGGTQVESIKVDISYSGNNAITAFVASTTGGPGYVSGDVIITPISNDWVRVEFSLTDYSSTAVQIICVHYSRDFSPSGTDYDVTLWGSEVTTLDRTPTANELRPVSNGVVDFDAYPPEHRSLFADLEDAGDNWYKVTTKITDI